MRIYTLTTFIFFSHSFNLEDGVQVKDINNQVGRDFIRDTWKYSASGSEAYIEKCLKRSHSSGVYLGNGSVVSGAFFTPLVD